MDIAAFDFDGTLIEGDSLWMFARFAVGRRKLIAALIKSCPEIIKGKIRGDMARAKERLITNLFRGFSLEALIKKAEDFAKILKQSERQSVAEKLNEHLRLGHEVFIISASARLWIEPWAAIHGIDSYHILATELETDDDQRLTGRFSTPNCRGREKVRRLLAVRPDRSSYKLYAYGDSTGDRQLLDFADYSYNINRL